MAPGDYKTKTGSKVPGQPALAAGVLITKPNIYLRGMNRNTVIVDGTKPGTSKCSRKASAQNPGPAGLGSRLGLNGDPRLEREQRVGAKPHRLQLPHRRGRVGQRDLVGRCQGRPEVDRPRGYVGSYLNATSTYFDQKHPDSAAAYGIFSSRWNGGTWNKTYASNFNDSGYYIGACQQVCNQVVNHAWGEYSALGYSGSNSGGNMLIENSEFDKNTDGFSTNSQNGDNPPPQNGACPHGATSPITHTTLVLGVRSTTTCTTTTIRTCLRWGRPRRARGTGMSVSGGRNDTIMHNRFVNNNAWGVIFVAYPDSGQAVHRRHAELAVALARKLSLRRLGRPPARQHVLPQRPFQEPDERRLRTAEPRVPSERLLLG